MQASQHASWFYDTNFQSLFMPAEINVGYQPTFGLTLALAWKLFGKSLPTSHLFMLPFLLGIVWQLYLLVERFFNTQARFIVLLLLLLEPTLLAQATMVSTDIIMVFLYLLGLNLILRQQRIALLFVLIALSMLHLRGTVAVAALFFTDVLLHTNDLRPPSLLKLVRLSMAYIPATLLVAGWFLVHWLHYGWLLQNPDPNWAYYRDRAVADFPLMLRNIVVIGWRLADFGRIVVWLVGFISVFLLLRRHGS